MSELAPPKDLSHHFSRTTRNRQPSSIKDFYKYFTLPGIGNLAGGLPNAHYFPFDTLEASVALPTRWKPTPNDPFGTPSGDLEKSAITCGRNPSRIRVPHHSSVSNTLCEIDLTTALQYGTAQGYPPLFSFLRQFAREHLHPNLPYKDGAEIVLTCGSTDGFAKSIEAFTNPWDGGRDPIQEREGMLCEEFAYMNAIQAVRPRGLNVIPVAIDDEGMLATGEGGLADILERWDKNNGKRPHLMYTVTIGQNPTSGLLSLPRRKEIYALCQKYDILIIEDDPYWHLQYPSANAMSVQARGKPISANYPIAPESHNYNADKPKPTSGFPFLDSLVPSYLHVDTDGRVIRLDTFSKTVAPGCRLGWITAQPRFIEKLLRITETFTQQPSGFVQSMIAELIVGSGDASKGARRGSEDGCGWNMSGWVRWLEGLRGNYERRMQIMSSILESGKYTISSSTCPRLNHQGASLFDEDDFQLVSKTQMYDFTYPMAGMFLWMRINWGTHPLFGKVDPQRLAKALWIHLTRKPYRVLVAPGSIFCPTQKLREEKSWQHFRLCFAAVDDGMVQQHSIRVVEGFKDFWSRSQESDIDDILEDEEVASREGIEDGISQCWGPC